MTTSPPFVHTARRSYRLNGPVKCSDRGDVGGPPPATSREVHRTLSFRGRRSRNKVSVGEPAEGSLSNLRTTREHVTTHRGGGARREPVASVALPVREAPEPRPPSCPAHGGDGPRRPSRANNEPRRGTRQGTSQRSNALPSPRSRRRGLGSSPFHQTQTTLGNGYLGSRIDEERSKMRYLV